MPEIPIQAHKRGEGSASQPDNNYESHWGAWVSIIVAVILVTGGLVYWFYFRIPAPEQPTEVIPPEVVEAFRDELTDRALERGPHPVEGFDAFLLLRAFPGLEEADFNGVQSGGFGEEGIYVYAGGELTWQRTTNRSVTSAEGTISTTGYQTLLENLADRLGMPTTSPEDAIAIVNAVDLYLSDLVEKGELYFATLDELREFLGVSGTEFLRNSPLVLTPEVYVVDSVVYTKSNPKTGEQGHVLRPVSFIDAQTIERIDIGGGPGGGVYILKDKNGIYAIDSTLEYVGESRVFTTTIREISNDEIDVGTFKKIGWYANSEVASSAYFADKNSVYYIDVVDGDRVLKRIPDADPATFTRLGESKLYARDHDSVFFVRYPFNVIRPIPGADADTFEVLPDSGSFYCSYARDKNNAYFNGEVFDGDPERQPAQKWDQEQGRTVCDVVN